LASANTWSPSETRAVTLVDGSPVLNAVQVASCVEIRLRYTPAAVATHSESPRCTTPLMTLLANGDGLIPSGSVPTTPRPSHSASPPAVPIQTVSPTASSALIESDGSPSNPFTTPHVPLSSSRLAPASSVPAHTRPVRSIVTVVR
jgi:hypothetical protein